MYPLGNVINPEHSHTSNKKTSGLLGAMEAHEAKLEEICSDTSTDIPVLDKCSFYYVYSERWVVTLGGFYITGMHIEFRFLLIVADGAAVNKAAIRTLIK